MLGTFTPLGGRYLNTVFAVGGKHAVESRAIHPRLGYQGRQFGDKSNGSKMT
jgi:hypothetical protein